MPHTFLSDAWLDEAKKINEEVGGGAMPAGIQRNVFVTGGPEGDKELHMSSDGFGGGFLEGAGTKLILPFDLAKKMFIEGDQSAGMQAFMSGQIKVEGDMTKLMAMQGAPAGGADKAAEIAEKLKAITA